MTAVKCESAELSGVRCIFDEKAKPLKEQILAYMTAEPLGEAAAGITQKVHGRESDRMRLNGTERRKKMKEHCRRSFPAEEKKSRRNRK